MKLVRSIAHIVLIALSAVLSLTAVAGGFALLTGLNTPPVSQLEGTIFRDFTVPGLALCALVGGGAALAAVLLIRNNRLAYLFAVLAGIIIMFFEFVEVLTIGSPPGPAFLLQLFYFALGVLIVLVALGIQLIDLARARS